MRHTDTTPMAKNTSTDILAATASVRSQPNNLMSSAPIQKASGASLGMDRPAMLGANQSASDPCAMVHMMPKPAASSVFHGSRRSIPGSMYSKHMTTKPQRGKASVAAAGSRTGFIQSNRWKSELAIIVGSNRQCYCDLKKQKCRTRRHF